jgi:hypothetical protein
MSEFQKYVNVAEVSKGKVKIHIGFLFHPLE